MEPAPNPTRDPSLRVLFDMIDDAIAMGADEFTIQSGRTRTPFAVLFFLAGKAVASADHAPTANDYVAIADLLDGAEHGHFQGWPPVERFTLRADTSPGDQHLRVRLYLADGERLGGGSAHDRMMAVRRKAQRHNTVS